MQEQDPGRQHSHWGPLSTILWGVFILLLFVVTQAITVVVYLVATRVEIAQGHLPAAVVRLQYDGLLVSLCTFATAVVCCPVIIGISRLKRGSNVKEYLGLALPTKQRFVSWFLAIVVFIVLSDGISLFLGKSVVPEFMWKTYSSLRSPWILWMALLVAAPLFEELFYRGFLIKGLSASALRWYGAVIVSSAAWAIMHVQYDIYGIATIFLLGLILGTARVKTGSVILTMFLHSFCSFVATVEVVIQLRHVFA